MNLYVSPLVIGFDSATFALAPSARPAFSSGAGCPSGVPTTRTPLAGIVVSLGYMLGTAILTPDLWIEPLGALVKTGPAIVLMLVALLTLDNR